MRLKEFEEKVMEKKDEGLRIIGFVMEAKGGGHVARCYGRVNDWLVVLWTSRGVAFTHALRIGQFDMEDGDVFDLVSAPLPMVVSPETMGNIVSGGLLWKREKHYDLPK